MTRVVVIEDSLTQATHVRLLLQRNGYDVAVARDGEEGLEVCFKEVPDVVITDVVMPGINGYEVTRRLKGDPRTAGVPVIVMTTLDEPSHVLEAVEAGADNYVTKPVQEAHLVLRVGRAVGQRPTPQARPALTPALVDVLVSCLEDAVGNNEAMRRKQEALERTNTQREEAMRVVAHELRGPLQALSMRATAVQALPEPAALLATLPGAIDDQVKSMVRIIDDLTDLTDLDLGRLTLAREPVEVAALVERAVSDARVVHPDRTLNLHVSVSGPGGTVHADDGRVLQVLRNLVGNALKYAAHPAQVSVFVDALDASNEVEVRVDDAGPGLSPQDAERVFERYFRGPSKTRGAGLGLYICRRIVELHGGSIGVNTELGLGATFWFRLPRSVP